MLGGQSSLAAGLLNPITVTDTRGGNPAAICLWDYTGVSSVAYRTGGRGGIGAVTAGAPCCTQLYTGQGT